MDLTRVALSALELLVTIGMAVLVVYVTMRALIRANTDFDEDKEIARGNVSVGLLVAALLLASANIMHNAFTPAADAVRAHFSGPAGGATHAQVLLYAIGNLALGFVVVVATLSFSLRLFGRLTRSEKTRPGKELERGNLAVGILLSCVVLIVSMFVGGGVQALSKALIPAPRTARIQIMR
jgi:uncharacterized membrane protein YjfL (UPF0719 family)